MKRFVSLLSIGLLSTAALAAAACDEDDVNEAIDDSRTEISGVIDDTQTEIAEIDDEESPEGDATAADETPGAGGGEGDRPSVEIASPDDGETISGSSVTIEVDPSDFEVVDKLGEPAAEGEGHVHFYRDVDEVPTTPGQPAVSDEGTYHATATTEHTWENVEPGTHTFAVQLVNNDHTPLEPPVVMEITVEVTD
jgi:hypothetical protein